MTGSCLQIGIPLAMLLFMAPAEVLQVQSLRDHYNKPQICTRGNADYTSVSFLFCVDGLQRVTKYSLSGDKKTFIGTLGRRKKRNGYITEIHDEDGKLVEYRCVARARFGPDYRCRNRPRRSVIGSKEEQP